MDGDQGIQGKLTNNAPKETISTNIDPHGKGAGKAVKKGP